MQQFRKHARTVLLLAALGLIGLASIRPDSAPAQAKENKKTPAAIVVTPPPVDVNDLSLEVAALRTLYLLKAESRQFDGIKNQDCVPALRKRQAPNVSNNYRTVLTELRAAFIAGQEDRINELSEQLDELTKEEDPDLDDAVEITEKARARSPFLLRWFEADMIVKYLAAYDKDFPSPRNLMYETMRLDGKGKKPTPEQWATIRPFVIREVSWMIGGLDPEKQKKIGGRVAKLLDRAYALSDEDLEKQKAELNEELAKIKNQAGPTDILKHVIEQDLAELLSNPRLLPAMEARVKYLRAKSKQAKN